MANPKDAMNRLKFEIASQVGVSLKDGYNGDLTSSQAGKVGGNIVKKLINDAKNTLK
ncbi:MAG: alpha/beta-type small acid-soluble spore protein [Deltaproteobacteria bacterium]